MLEKFMKEANEIFTRFAPHIKIIGFDKSLDPKLLASYSSFSVPQTGDRIRLDIDGKVRSLDVEKVTHIINVKHDKVYKNEIYISVEL